MTLDPTLLGAWTMLETRAQSVKVEGNILRGIAVPFEEWTEIHERGVTFREKFVRGSIDVPDSAVLQFSHQDGGVPLARVGAGTITFTDSPEGLRFEASIPESRKDITEALERGDLDGSVSIGFHTVEDRKTPVRNGGVSYLREVLSATLDHLAVLASEPAYKSAKAEFSKNESQ